ncbi:hypothetical protein [Ktedonobacter racemifer]|uniref:hypothetical protein n=1 Tax=Ktedonobacter racemifer TaxID=363277 RepID=UPI00058ED8FB|nr:hypothetical protein [Ktedonobacter racemifer]
MQFLFATGKEDIIIGPSIEHPDDVRLFFLLGTDHYRRARHDLTNLLYNHVNKYSRPPIGLH